MRLVALLLAALLLPVSAAAQDEDLDEIDLDHPTGPRTDEALEEIYVAADKIDKAAAERLAGRLDDARALLEVAGGHLDKADRLDPSLPRIGYERARMLRLGDRPTEAEQVLLPSMRAELPVTERTLAVELLDGIRADLGRPSVAVQWNRSARLRDIGVVAVLGGLAAAGAGIAVAYDSFVTGAADGVTDAGVAANSFGWALTGIGAGVAAGGGAMVVVGELSLNRLRAVLPGPWHLEGARKETRVVLELRGTLPGPRTAGVQR